MQRRDFLGLVALFGLSGCRFEESPYSAKPSRKNLNAKNISRLSAASQSTPEPFRIGVVSDTHTYYDDYQKVIRDIRDKNRCDFLIHCGDVTDSGLLREFEWGDEITQKAGLPYVIVIGNHDALANGTPIYREMYGPFNFSFAYNRAHVICFNNNNWEFGVDVPDFEWLEAELAAKPLGEVKIVATHVPPFDNDRFTASQKARFHTLMQNYNVACVINGHKHNPLTAYHDGIPYITVGSVSKKTYITLDVTATDASMERIDV